MYKQYKKFEGKMRNATIENQKEQRRSEKLERRSVKLQRRS